VTDKGLLSFAAEKAGGTKVHLDAAKVMKPCSELNRFAVNVFARSSQEPSQ
jgi:hypothetical protein